VANLSEEEVGWGSKIAILFYEKEEGKDLRKLVLSEVLYHFKYKKLSLSLASWFAPFPLSTHKEVLLQTGSLHGLSISYRFVWVGVCKWFYPFYIYIFFQ